MKFRKAELEDISELNRISLVSKRHWGYPEEWIENWMDALTLLPENIKQQQILIGAINSEIIGFCSITENEKQYEILHLWLLPEFIGRGYGKKLLSQTLKEFINTDKPVIVEADPNAEPFYKGQGFVTFDKIESSPPGRFLPVMKKARAYNF